MAEPVVCHGRASGVSGALAIFLLVGCGTRRNPPEESRRNEPARPGLTNAVALALKPASVPPPIVKTNLPGAAAQATSTVERISPATNTISGPPANADTKAIDSYNSGVRYLLGDGVAQSISEAVKNFRAAADLGHPGAQHNLAVLYLQGRGVEKDAKQAAQWLRAAADRGLAEAQFKLASLYAAGLGVARDLKEAAVWARKAAEQGHVEAQYNLATLYASGRGVEPNFAEAIRWYRQAAEKGKTAAQCNLGVLYATGQGVTRDQTEALKWFRKAAEQGHPLAQFNLARAFEEGNAPDEDPIEAYKWCLLAAGQGDEDATKLQLELSLKLNAADLAEAIRRANAFTLDLTKRVRANSEPELVLPPSAGDALLPPSQRTNSVPSSTR